MAKKFKVGYKTINAKLLVTKRHLEKIRKNVSAKDKKEIDTHLNAIKVILAACKVKMSATYSGTGDD